jgi:hypothetical protein
VSAAGQTPRDHEPQPIFTLELWQLVLIVVGVIVLVGRVLLGASIPHPSGKAPLLIVALLLVLGLLLFLRKRQRSS